jgi:hypothetical protein
MIANEYKRIYGINSKAVSSFQLSQHTRKVLNFYSCDSKNISHSQKNNQYFPQRKDFKHFHVVECVYKGFRNSFSMPLAQIFYQKNAHILREKLRHTKILCVKEILKLFHIIHETFTALFGVSLSREK